nr:hypothetical protein CFP56_22768 [Quercus suber]
MSTNLRITHYGRRSGVYMCNRKSKTCYREPSRILFQQRLILSVEMVITDDCCDHCKCAPEDVVHVLWSCLLLSSVCTRDPYWNFSASPPFASFRDLVEHFIETGSDLNLFSTTLWTFWFRRNVLRTSSKPYPVQQVFHEARFVRVAYVHSIPPKPPD